MQNDISAEASVVLEGHRSGTKESSELLALTDPQKETKLRTFLYPTNVYYLQSPRDKSLLLQTRGAHLNLGKT